MAYKTAGKTEKVLMEERATLIANARKHHEENADNWSEEHQKTFVAMTSDASDCTNAINNLQALSSLESASGKRLVDDPQERLIGSKSTEKATVKVREGSDRSGNPVYRDIEAGTRGSAAYQKVFEKALRTDSKHLSADEMAALQSDDNTQAGYLLTSEQFAAGLLQDVDDLLFIRRFATVHTVPDATSLGIRKRTTRMSTFAYGQELQTATADTALAFGKKVLTPHHLTGQILVSRDLVRRSSQVVGIVRSEMARNAGEAMEDKFLSGAGGQEPLGVFTASTDGISTGRDVSTGNTTTAITADGLISAKMSLKSQYRMDASCRWLFSRTGVTNICKLKDGAGQYLWQPGLQAGQANMLLGHPVDESERSPSTFTTGLYVGMFCNWKYYEIADALDMEIQVLVELYAQTGQICYIGRLKNDGVPTLEEAFARVKLA